MNKKRIAHMNTRQFLPVRKHPILFLEAPMLNQTNRLWHVISICVCAILVLSACTPPSFPIEITVITVSPDPIIGQVATLHVEVMSTEDEPDTTILIELPEGVKLMDGDLMWHGSLTANEVQAHEVSICVLYEGDWELWIEAHSQLSENSSYEDAETLHLQSTTESARVILGSNYHLTQPPGGFNMPTPLSVTGSPECSGQAG
jgi:hypothetical protein